MNHPSLRYLGKVYRRHREKALYLVVGAWNTLFGFCFWALLQNSLGDDLSYVGTLILAWPFVVLNAYLGYRFIVFRSKGPVRSELPRFALVYLVVLVANLIFLPIALQLVPSNIYVVEALFTATIIAGSYLAHRFFSFDMGSA